MTSVAKRLRRLTGTKYFNNNDYRTLRVAN